MTRRLKGRNKQRRRHPIMFSSVVTGLMTSSVPAFSAECSGTGTQTCTIQAGETFTQQYGKVLYNPLTSSSHDTRNGNGTDNLQIYDYGGIFTTSSGFDEDHGVLYGHTFGSEAEGAGKGGNAGSVKIQSDGTISLSAHGSDVPRGFVTARSIGGPGETGTNHDYNSDGGKGGDGNEASIIVRNTAHYVFEGTTSTNFGGVMANSQGGQGGRQSDQLLGDQNGGKGGAGGLASVDNAGKIHIGVGTPIQSSGNVITGIQASSLGGSGGYKNGSSGDGAQVKVNHSGEVIVQVASSNADQRVYGIYAHSNGRDGYKSSDNDNRGGKGGSAGDVSVTARSPVQVNLTGAGAAKGGAIVATSEGGKGGGGPSGNVGGDGGNGGHVTVSLMDSESGYLIGTSGNAMRGVLALSKGGEGGDGSDKTALAGRSGGGGFGGKAGIVNVDTYTGAAISTRGEYADGIAAMSLGGGGGTAGDFVGILGGGAGNGGNGGDAADVAVRNRADITTLGNHSTGVLAQSISGGGGAGGVAAGLVLELGGDGAAGGTPGNVIVTNAGTIATSGYSAKGMIAQSISDGGGAGGTAGGILAIGGNASSNHQSAAGNVSLSNTGTVRTIGDAAIGMVAQSIGAGGGAGAGATGIIGVGGQGAAGGKGGQVDLTALGSVTTQGSWAHGVTAQSIGGGGGTGGDVFDIAAVVGVGVGGSGSGGGDAGSVTVTGVENANIITAGYGSLGLIAQSIGGGGGSGGDAVGAGIAELSMQIGGSGGGAGSGGSVTIDRSNLGIRTAGGMAPGLLAQSVGGGGGNGGGIQSYTAGLEVAVSMGVGGSGGVGGDGGAVGVSLKQSNITTTGSVTPPEGDPIADNATAILAQSIGGGGGSGGNSVVDNFVLGVPVEPGVGAAVPISLSIGGQGSAAGDGKAVNVDLVDTVLSTYGQYSRGVHAQSIGGGGGNGGDSSVFSVSVSVPTTTLSLSLASAVGGQCSDGRCPGGDGGDVSVALRQSQSDASRITTTGDYASGILAHSIGGGGGSGGPGTVTAYNWGALSKVNAGFGLGGKGDVGGKGGNVDVILEPGTSLSTEGVGAPGVLAQSIGGGGGTSQGLVTTAGVGVGFSEIVKPTVTVSVGVGREGGEGGDAGATTMNNAGRIATSGRNSDGIMLQSIGGGGGVGGSLGASKGGLLNTVASTIQDLLDLQGALSRSTDTAMVMNAAEVAEVAEDDKKNKPFSIKGVFQLGVGGVGGTGGDGGTVRLVNSGIIETTGDNSDGIVAQSIGGGGGEGGASTTSGKYSTISASLSVGGSGGSGGQGGLVDIDLENGSQIHTQGTQAYGVIGQSIGGGGGMGGIGTMLQKGLFNIGSAVGGQGGAGTHGGEVKFAVKDNNVISTQGSASHGVVLQSIGNGGGIGGTASFGANSMFIDFQLILSLGGGGGDGGDGGAVTACGYEAGCYAANISTAGDHSIGMIAQSVGGGGGVGGASDLDDPEDRSLLEGISIAVGLELGGNGGAGGNGGVATIDGDFNVTTQGDLSAGLVAQSIGGGGGLGMARTPYFTMGDHYWDERLTLRLGGKEGAGGDGGMVNLINGGNISTLGHGSHGMVAQSIGGGGGLTGASIKRGSADMDSPGMIQQLDQWVGGAAQSNGSAVGDSYAVDHDVITVASAGNIRTEGDWALGVLAQSIGGGGGASFVDWEPIAGATTEDSRVVVGGGGRSDGSGSDVAIRLSRADETAIHTSGAGSYGILGQSIGGGGGFGAALTPLSGVAVTVGSTGSSNGSVSQKGGQVRLSGEKTIVTEGADAHGVVLQSIGGGGGVAGLGVSANAVAGAMQVGGDRNSATQADASNVFVDNGMLRIGTSGDRAFGLVAQSIGGGGGIAVAGASSNLSQVTLGARGTTTGTAGRVNISLANGTQISTQGRGAHAVVAQSIGGGGGIAGDVAAGDLAIRPIPSGAGSSGGGGDGNEVTLAVTGDISTSGEGAYGILMQSIGGGGGLSGDASGAFAGSSGTGGGSSGMMHLSQSGSVMAVGNNSVAVFAQSQGVAQDGGMDLTLNGAVRGGGGAQGAGVWMVGGNRNWLAVRSTASVSSGSNVAIRYSGTRTTAQGSVVDMENYGVITGDILLTNLDSAAAGSVTNNGSINPVPAYKVSTDAYSAGILRGAHTYGANIVNHGLLMVGRQGAVDGTTVMGDFTQGAQGALLVDADFELRQSDLLRVQGDAQVDGKLDIAPLTLLPHRRLTVMAVDGEASGTMTPRVSPIFNYALNRSGNEYQLSVDGANFTASSLGLGANQAALAGHLQEIWNSSSSHSFGKLFASIDMAAAQGLGDYRQLISNLSPDVMLAPASQTSASMVRFNNSMMSCPQFGGADAMTGEAECLWGTVGRRETSQDAYNDAAGFSNHSNTIQVGGQKRFAPDWFVNVSAAYSADTLKADSGRVRGKGDTVSLGAMVKHEMGPWTLAGGLSGSYGRYDMDRQVLAPGFGHIAKSDPEVYSGTARFRVARTFAFPAFYLKPYMDLDAIYARMPGYTEDGAALAYKVDGSDQFTFAFSPTLEVGGRVDVKGGTLRPYVQVGGTFLTNKSWTARARFANAPNDVGGFQVSLPMDDAVARIGAGLQFSTDKGIDVRLQYEGEFSGKGSSNSGFLKVAVPF